MSGEILAVSDADVFLALQSGGKGVVPSAFKSALRYTEVQVGTTIDGVQGEPSLGGGMYTGPDIGLSFAVEWSARGRVTLKTLPAHLFQWFCARTSTGTGPYVHTYNPIKRNYNLPWLAMAVVYGEGDTLGAGMATRFVRDARLSGLDFTISSTDVVRFNLSGPGLNMGPGLGTEGFAADTTDFEPVPSNPGTNVFTWPTTGWTGVDFSALCVNSIQFRWTPQFQLAAPCLNSGEHAGMVITSARWELTFNMRLDSDSMNLVDLINFKATAAAAATAGKNYNALDPAYKTGPFTFLINSLENIGGSSPLNVPYQFGGSFPLQWVRGVARSDQSPNTVEVTARTYTDTWFITARNGVAGASMDL